MERWRWVIALLLGMVMVIVGAKGMVASEGSFRSDISGLRSRVTRLESEVGFLKSAVRQRSQTSSIRLPASPATDTTDLGTNPQFQNLAIRVAELQNSLEELENQVSQLKNSCKSWLNESFISH